MESCQPIRRDRVWAAVQDGLTYLTVVVLPELQATDSAEDFYWALQRQAEVIRLLIHLDKPQIAKSI